jgi:hypothetical protein
MCRHIYEEVHKDYCPDCGEWTHRTDWEKQNMLAEQWRKDNPNAGEGVWWSI